MKTDVDFHKDPLYMRNLVERAIAEDAVACDALWRLLVSLVARLTRVAVARRSGNCRCDHEDIIQNVLMELWRTPEILLDVVNIEGWLFRMIDRRTVDEMRRQSRHSRSKSLEGALSDEDDRCLESFLGVEGDQVPRVILKEVENILDSQPKEKGDIFRLYLYGYSYEEISQRMKVPQKTVGVWIYRLKKELRRQLT